MTRSTRVALVVGLGLVGAAGLVGRSVAQQPQQDPKLRQAATTAPAGPASVSIGTIDMDSVLKNYDKFKVATQTLQAEAMARQNELMKIMAEAKSTQEMYQKLTPGSPDAKKCEDKITMLEGQFEAGRKNAEREFTQKESETMAGIYNEIQKFARYIAQQRGMTFVIKFTDQEAKGSEPNSVMAVMSRTVLYADARVDITAQVTNTLNEAYRKAGGVAPKPEPAAAGAAAPGAAARPAPAAGAAPAPAAAAARPAPARN
ncbi:OmpH family outer membrane protein [Tundrisphaera sp. TA3]|uniref:OmpH family outer membrane protein n=1 Tax=Tundrisphaera sp. TA3 TaxID=3435775 RepID=UPI003EBCAF1F